MVFYVMLMYSISLSLSWHTGPLTLTLHGEADTSYFDFFSPEDALEPMPCFDSEVDKGKRDRRGGGGGENSSSRDSRDRHHSDRRDGGDHDTSEQEDLTSFSFSNF